LIRSEIVLGLPAYEITDLQIRGGGIHISARYTGLRSCPHCGCDRLRNKGRYVRRVRHENWGLRHCVLFEISMPGLRALLPGAVSRDSVVPAVERSFPKK
jgi:hypothetical protein